MKISKVFKKQKFLFTNCVDRLNYKVSKENERWRIDKSRFIILRLDLKTMLYFWKTNITPTLAVFYGFF